MTAVGELIDLFDARRDAWHRARCALHRSRDSRFAERASTLVVEFGNAHHQAIADAYVAGEDVPIERVFHDFVGAGTNGFRAAIYPEFFATVRAVNQTLPTARRLRVLLGDPPLDWSTASPADVLAAADSRDEHFARVVGDHRNALLFAGAFHLMKTRAPPGGPGFLQLLELERPTTCFRPIVTKSTRSSRRCRCRRCCESQVAGFFGSRVDPFAQSGLTLGQLGDRYFYLGPSTRPIASSSSAAPSCGSRCCRS
jgi:hypothetical protein